MRKGQFQTLEPVIVVIALVFIFGIALFYYVQISGNRESAAAAAFDHEQELALLATVSQMPELSCASDVSASTCIDLYKAKGFAELLKDERARTYYYPLLGASNITLRWVDLSTGKHQSLTLYTNTKGTEVKAARTYFTLYDPVQKSFYFTTMIIERES